MAIEASGGSSVTKGTRRKPSTMPGVARSVNDPPSVRHSSPRARTTIDSNPLSPDRHATAQLFSSNVSDTFDAIAPAPGLDSLRSSAIGERPDPKRRG